MAKHLTRRHRKALKRCNRTGLVILATELDAKMVLATRVWKDSGEKRYFPCEDHFHLTAMEAMPS